MPRYKRFARLLLAAVLVIASTAMPGCIVLRTAGNVVGTGVKSVGRIIGSILPGKD